LVIRCCGAFVAVEHLWRLIMRVLFLGPPLLLLLTLLLVALLLLSFCCYKADGLVIIYRNFSPAAVGGTANVAAVGGHAAG
jgi:hypothetical protein